MTAGGAVQLVLYVLVLLALAKPLGAYMARVFEGRPCGLDQALGWLERLVYRLAGIRPAEEMSWKTYAVTMLLFNLAGLLAVYGSGGSRGCCRSTRRTSAPSRPIPRSTRR
jgi:potassium-transporting ATPase potassium-binding subunit